ncbi:DUF1905 domain-containing protein [Clavibacter michiganensis]|uniref:DUF1905 domain-containing protein n=1 Tax=Clavibacter michiganensis TaxID=28447 RepID=UPI000B695744|nr:DUF1905 domain-containing protein [Clavibacter michiganensis]MDO4100167.1 DUF1905 domain-containing protein [Clavibacter michiganensis]MDO4128456.1 DUF1905 domain-containing protein [Clavibacter michiganensis]OUE29214.1 hypothetical protein CMMCA001_00580 [Clavibacter michiganensis subsp. michiganensis]
MPTFRTRVLQARVNATGLPVPPEALDELGAGKRPAVVVTVAGYTSARASARWAASTSSR